MNSFIDGSCRRPNSVARFRKQDVNNNGEFSYFSSLFPQQHIMSNSPPPVGPRRRRLLPRMAASVISTTARPQCPDSLDISASASPTASAAALAQLLCLRCATHAARDPVSPCRFDKPKSKKCACCRDQKSSCDPVGFSPFISVFVLLTPCRSRLPWPSGASTFSGVVASLGRPTPRPGEASLPQSAWPQCPFVARSRSGGGIRPLPGRWAQDCCTVCRHRPRTGPEPAPNCSGSASHTWRWNWGPEAIRGRPTL